LVFFFFGLKLHCFYLEKKLETISPQLGLCTELNLVLGLVTGENEKHLTKFRKLQNQQNLAGNEN
jgi:hypothetical protein